MPRGQLQGVLDSERFNLLRTLDFFTSFGDVELWEVVHRAKWQRFHFGHALYRKGEEGNSFHIIAQGEVEVFRDGKKVAQLGAGTSVGEMAYLAPSPELRRHSTDVIVTEPATTISFTPETLAQLSPNCRHHVRRGVHPRAGAAAACRARGARASAAHPLTGCCEPRSATARVRLRSALLALPCVLQSAPATPAATRTRRRDQMKHLMTVLALRCSPLRMSRPGRLHAGAAPMAASAATKQQTKMGTCSADARRPEEGRRAQGLHEGVPEEGVRAKVRAARQDEDLQRRRRRPARRATSARRS